MWFSVLTFEEATMKHFKSSGQIQVHCLKVAPIIPYIRESFWHLFPSVSINWSPTLQSSGAVSSTWFCLQIEITAVVSVVELYYIQDAKWEMCISHVLHPQEQCSVPDVKLLLAFMTLKNLWTFVSHVRGSKVTLSKVLFAHLAPGSQRCSAAPILLAAASMHRYQRQKLPLMKMRFF